MASTFYSTCLPTKPFCAGKNLCNYSYSDYLNYLFPHHIINLHTFVLLLWLLLMPRGAVFHFIYFLPFVSEDWKRKLTTLDPLKSLNRAEKRIWNARMTSAGRIEESWWEGSACFDSMEKSCYGNPDPMPAALLILLLLINCNFYSHHHCRRVVVDESFWNIFWRHFLEFHPKRKFRDISGLRAPIWDETLSKSITLMTCSSQDHHYDNGAYPGISSS